MKKYLLFLLPALLLILPGYSQNTKAFHFTPDTTFLPDGNGVSYTTSILVEGYVAGQTIISPFDIASLCVNMEHSFLGDLNIAIECPNGQSIALKAYPGGSGTYLGEPIDDDSNLGPGIGYDYCWTPDPEYGTMTNESGNVSTLPPGTYEPDEPFSDLIGCPLNGFWTITITDNLSIDNGYIFNWGLNLIHDPGCFTTTYGKLYVDMNENGMFDDGEPPIPYKSVIAEPGPYYGYSNSNGEYHLYLDSGNYVIYPQNVAMPWEAVNPEQEELEILTNTLDTIYGIDFGFTTDVYCPDLSVDVTLTNLAICSTPLVFVSYVNNGTAIAENAQITLELDENMTYTSGGNLVSESGNILTFDIGDVGIGESGSFTVYTQYSCDPDLAGLTACVEALITPNDPCDPVDPAWDHSSVSVEGSCVGDSLVCFFIENAGEPGEGDMAGPSQYRIYENENLVDTASFQINGGETMEVCWPANGNTIRLEADQRPGHPGNSHPQDAVELCGSPNNITGLILSVPQDDLDDFIEIDCLEVLGSLDPNDKRVVPTGITEEHLIDTTMSLEYTIRFQNTGTAPAELVIIKDTISELLDISTFRHLGSSHNCNIDFPTTNIVRWTFENIMLPDSSSSPEESIGFIKFRIDQVPNLDYGEIIWNKAGIYFDYNLPVITNNVHNKIGKFDGIILSQPVNYGASIEFEIYPNPANNQINVKSNETITSIEIFDLQGRLVKNITGINSNFHSFSRGTLENGVYYYQINSKNGISASGKLMFTD